MKKIYLVPSLSVIKISNNSLLCSSSLPGGLCLSSCKLWHICRDRKSGEWCNDKRT